ncbi:sensor histidine kinase [Filimonas effusa]|nr:HAMP domain-containing sensor histidine kinase [Filimonas effusa]
MKLLVYTSRNFLISTIIVLSSTGTILYFVLKTLIENEMLEQLDLQADMIVNELAQGRYVNYPLVEIDKINRISETPKITGDTLVFDYVTKEHEDFKYLKVERKIGSQPYRIKVMIIYIGWHKYYQVIFFLLSIAAVLMALAGVLLNYVLSKKLWKPFFFNLKQLNSYTLSRPGRVHFEPSHIREFNELRYALEELTERSRREYLALKEFAENASHEMQTPLGIIQSKLDRMTQMVVDADMAGYIVQSKAAVERLRRTIKGLLFLAKLENDSYADKESVSVGYMLRSQFGQMEELFWGKNIMVDLRIEEAEIVVNRFLLETVVSNLLANALHYTPRDGRLNVVLHENEMIFINTGLPLTFPPELIFDRFKKGEQHSQSTGLGLAIVRQICMLNGWKINYSYSSGNHSFKIALQQEVLPGACPGTGKHCTEIC